VALARFVERVHFADAGTSVRAVLIILFLLLTAPIAAHMIGRATIASGAPLWRGQGEAASGKEE
jgi:multisubunit Na+/H+ antiporter MnhG subunit